MDKFFGNLNAVLGVGFALALALMATLHVNDVNASAVLQWLHVFFGITWIGLLYYFNFVQIPTMPTVPAELKPGVSKYIAPKALFFFRWGAAFTVLTGAALAYVNGFLVEALSLRDGFQLIGTGNELTKNKAKGSKTGFDLNDQSLGGNTIAEDNKFGTTGP